MNWSNPFQSLIPGINAASMRWPASRKGLPAPAVEYFKMTGQPIGNLHDIDPHQHFQWPERNNSHQHILARKKFVEKLHKSLRGAGIQHRNGIPLQNGVFIIDGRRAEFGKDAFRSGEEQQAVDAYQPRRRQTAQHLGQTDYASDARMNSSYANTSQR